MDTQHGTPCWDISVLTCYFLIWWALIWFDLLRVSSLCHSETFYRVLVLLPLQYRGTFPLLSVITPPSTGERWCNSVYEIWKESNLNERVKRPHVCHSPSLFLQVHALTQGSSLEDIRVQEHAAESSPALETSVCNYRTLFYFDLLFHSDCGTFWKTHIIPLPWVVITRWMKTILACHASLHQFNKDFSGKGSLYQVSI